MSFCFLKNARGAGIKLPPLSNPASASDVLNGYEGYDDTGTQINGNYTPSLPTLNAPSISIASDTLTITDSANNGTFTSGFKIYIDGTLVSTQNTNTYSLASLQEGTYSIKAKAFATNFNDSADSNVESYTVAPQSAPIYGVSGLYDSATTLTRTDDAVGMSWTMSNNEISSDFDNVFPYNQMVRETINGNVFVKVPAIYWRIGYDSNNYITDIAVSEQPITAGANQVAYKSEAFYYGAYGAHNNSGTMQSVSGVSRTYSQTRATFRSQATANGTGYTLIDLVHTRILEFLWLIEFADKNSENIMWGYTNYGGTTGATDSLTAPSGQLAAKGRMRYRYIEDFVGNGLEFFDGIASGYVSANPANYSDNMSATGIAYTVGGAGSNNELAALGIVDMTNSLLATPAYTVNNASNNTYFCDRVTTNSVVFCRGRNLANSIRGLFSWYSDSVSYSDGTIGSRLLYVPQS